MDADNRRFSLLSLLGVVALFAVSLLLIRLGSQFPDTVVRPVLGVLGGVWLVAGLGAAAGFVVSGKRGLAPWAALAIIATLFLTAGLLAYYASVTTTGTENLWRRVPAYHTKE